MIIINEYLINNLYNQHSTCLNENYHEENFPILEPCLISYPSLYSQHMAQLLGGSCSSWSRLAVVLIQHPENKILSITRTESSTGKVEAETVKAVLDEWELTDKIIACGFDTTSSNTGIRNGSCVLLQQLLSRQLLWPACRHHHMELVIGAAFFQLFGDTKAPEVVLFKTLKKKWDSLNLDDLKLPEIPASTLDWNLRT